MADHEAATSLNETADEMAAHRAERTHQKNRRMAQTFFIVLTQIIIVTFVVNNLMKSFSGDVKLFTWHPILFTLSFFCMVEGILIYAPFYQLSKYLIYQRRVTLHWILETSALILAISGATVIFINKNNLNKPHFQTIHALVGVGANTFIAITALGGLATYYNASLKAYMKASTIKVCHSLSGLVTYSLASSAVALSLYKAWYEERSSQLAQTLTLLSICFLFLIVVVKPLVSIKERLKHIL